MKVVVMGVTDSKKIILLVFLAFFLILSGDRAEGRRRLSQEEDLELDRQLKLINKPAIRSIQTEYGDILDCVDINKQLAFDHPLLKNHTIQMRPKSIPKGMTNKASSSIISQVGLKNIKCPRGSVPIWRMHKRDLLQAKYISSLGRKYPRNILPLSSNVNTSDHYFAVLEMKGENYGSKAELNAWGPKVSPSQFSIASIWIVNGSKEQTNSIQAGWGVNQILYQNFTRLYTYWTADGYQKTGCYNILCPGFVQISTEIPLGFVIHPLSTYNGPQYGIDLSIYQDRSTGHWWLVFGGNKYIRYWPNSIFTSLSNGASSIAWGGEVYSAPNEGSPAMGSGHFPTEGFARSCFFKNIQVTYQPDLFSDPNPTSLSTYQNQPKCYDIIYGGNKGGDWGSFFYFGGPELCKI